ncbi:hypothetical protein [uncultured Nonlabens sp.]|uniref:hypothetical protein n=1 Tax=uncultured Nonlabens sp. TaxID=859306 RepID=UPI002633F6A5|nr:hypothetical protein [uncultured Nonlabens sp.]
MRKIYVVIIASLLLSVIMIVTLKAQDVKENHEIVKEESDITSLNNQIPLFEFLQQDGTPFSKYDLDKQRNLILVYFDPDCGLCEKSGAFFKTFAKLHASSQVIFTSPASWDNMIDYKERHELDKVSNVSFLQCDSDQFFTLFKEAGTPTYFIYDKKQELVKTINDQLPAPLLIKYIKGAQME